MIKLLPLVTAASLLAGCGTAKPIAIDANHPANPNAPVAPTTVQSTTLAITPAPTSAPAAAPAPDGAQGMYVCPMHPEVVSDVPGQCPKCGMKLVRKEAGK
ncbi:MAG: hypothetical protein H7Z14_18595 [Anaerolineae bacterium]|nr:hypothetical protein [Phycisphaerae bacterium]